MHEFSVAQSIVETVLEVARKHNASRVLQVNLIVGEVALVNTEQLSWYIDMLTKETMAEGMKLHVTSSPVRIRCLDCGYEGGVRYQESDSHWHTSLPVFECPHCQSAQTLILSGRELHIKDMHVRFPWEEEEKKEDA
jgi:hydrogenase nickel incorporation protein HypA/HybF